MSLLDLMDFQEPDKKKSNVNRWITRRKKYNADFDFAATPGYPVERLLEVEKFKGNILEPACGDGAISKILEAHGYNVISKDLINRGYEKGQEQNFFHEIGIYDNIITNPPFKLATPFAYHAIQHVKRKVAFFIRIQFTETKKRKEWLFQNPDLPTYFKTLYVFSERVEMSGVGNMFEYCWFVWDKSHKGDATIKWL